MRPPPGTAEVAAFLLWTQWIWQTVLRGGPGVAINLDESALSRGMAPRRGHCAGHARAAARQRYARITLREARGHMTYVAAIASDATVQAALPQFVLGHEKRFTKADRAALRRLEAPVISFPGTKGWVTSENFCKILSRIQRAAALARPGVPIVLYMDCAPQHLSRRVLAHILRLQLCVVLVPGSLTWLLQPLDTHVFQRLKGALSHAQTAARAAAPSGALPPGLWIDLAGRAIAARVVAPMWENVMRANGLMGPGVMLRERIGDILGAQLPLPLRPPTAAELATLCGRTSAGLHERMLRAPLRLLAARAAHGAARPARAGPPVADRWPPARPGATAAVAGAAAAVARGAGGATDALPPRRTRSGALY